MRALPRGSIVLAIAVALLPWGATRFSTHFQAGSQVPSYEIRGVGLRSFAPQAQAMGGRALEGSRDDVGTSKPMPVESAATGSRPNSGPRHSPPNATRRLADISALAVPQLTPGSPVHAKAIASVLASEEFEDTVAPLARLYFAYFDRVADYEGLDYYIGERDDGTPLESIAEEFAGSPEFQMRYGSLDNAAFIDRVYRNVFDAPPDAAQRAYWVGQLDAGMTRGQVMLAFSESGTFRTLTGNEVFVTMAYAETLRRAPDSAGFARWVSFLEAGNPREAVIAGLLAARLGAR